MNWNFYNVIILGFAFMLIFTAFQTCSMIEQTVLESADGGNFTGSGYKSLCIIYGVFSFSNWIAPSVVAVVGAKFSMILGGIAYALFIGSIIQPRVWSLYSASVLIGLGAAVIWTAQGNFLTINSTATTIARNSGIFWALMQCSLFFGNLYIYFAFRGEEQIEDSTRITVFIVLTIVCGLGVLLLFFLRSIPGTEHQLRVNSEGEVSKTGPLTALVDSFKLFTTRRMAFLAVVFAYTGIEMTFFSGVYGTSVGHTLQFKDSKSLQGLTGILIGVGEVLGGLLFGILGKKTNKYGRDPVVLLGFLLHTISFYLTYLNLPATSPFEDTQDTSYLEPNEYIALGCAFLLGFGDSCYNTQIYSFLGNCFSSNSSSAFALFKFTQIFTYLGGVLSEQSTSAFALYYFVQSLAAAAAFFYTQSSVGLLLQYHLLILAIGNGLAVIAFIIVEAMSRRVDPGDTQYERVPQCSSSEEQVG